MHHITLQGEVKIHDSLSGLTIHQFVEIAVLISMRYVMIEMQTGETDVPLRVIV